ncbi:hypothetical protein [Heyndrickxia sporothermodurans]|uniref:hypothetical protein n=1 Tax=Heyndrickxia sporothermodurans TaxID=46224 RepID=UPI0015E63A17|nr:hypothetical protein [Heyndrickxia sporothermodurans]
MLRTLLFDQQWCMLHYPEQPNGLPSLSSEISSIMLMKNPVFGSIILDANK